MKRSNGEGDKTYVEEIDIFLFERSHFKSFENEGACQKLLTCPSSATSGAGAQNTHQLCLCFSSSPTKNEKIFFKKSSFFLLPHQKVIKTTRRSNPYVLVISQVFRSHVKKERKKIRISF